MIMTTIEYAILSLCVFLAVLAVAKCLIDINELDKRIDEIIAEEKRQNKRIDLLEKREQIRQSEELRDKAYIESKDLFEKW
jgi:low affinity Fe/Cu permease